MDEIAPTPAAEPPLPTPVELNELRARMANAVAGCARCLTTVAALSEATPPTAAARRERCDRMDNEIDAFSENTGEFHLAHRATGGGWPADAPTGLTFNAVASMLIRVYLPTCELAHTICELGQSGDAGTAARVAGLRRAVPVLEDAAEYLRPGRPWRQAVPDAGAATIRSLREVGEVLSRYNNGGLTTFETLEYPALGGMAKVALTGLSCLVVPGSVPTVCERADPPLPRTLLGDVVRAFERLYHPDGGIVWPAGVTIHWIGHAAGLRGGCRCHPGAPSAAPADVGQWPGVMPANVHADSEGERTGMGDNSSAAPPGPAAQGVSDVLGAGDGLRCGVAADPAAVDETQPPSPWHIRAGGALVCSPDCGVVRFDDADHYLSGGTRAAFGFMLSAYEHEDRRDTFSTAEILDAAGSAATRVRDALRPSGGTYSIWNTFVVQVEGRQGFYRFRLPPFGEEFPGPL